MRPSRARFSSEPSGHSAGSCRGSPRRRARPCGGASPPSSSSRSSGRRPLTSRFCRRRRIGSGGAGGRRRATRRRGRSRYSRDRRQHDRFGRAHALDAADGRPHWSSRGCWGLSPPRSPAHVAGGGWPGSSHARRRRRPRQKSWRPTSRPVSGSGARRASASRTTSAHRSSPAFSSLWSCCRPARSTR